MNSIACEMDARLTDLGLHNICSWDPEKIIKRDQRLAFYCLKHGVENKSALYSSVVGRESGRTNPLTTPGCKLCHKESLQRNAELARASRAAFDRYDRYDTFDKHLRLDSRASAPCYFYIARITGRLIKPGIASDVKRRAYQAAHQGHPYKELIFVSEQIPRAVAWVAEQYILLKLKVPEKLPKWATTGKWAGSTELREGLAEMAQALFVSILPSIQADWELFYRSEILQA
jgi:hypothetical protein